MAKIYRIAGRKNFFNRLKVNTILVLINVVCFAVFSIIYFINPNFIDYIALKPSNILQAKYLWTFVTSMFMHAGLFHIFANMLSMFFIGGLVEKILGKRRYALFYLLAGLFAGLFFVLVSLLFPKDLKT